MWCREGESIPTISKGCRKVSPVRAKCNIDAGLPCCLLRSIKSRFGRLPVVWGDFGRHFPRKSQSNSRLASAMCPEQTPAIGLDIILGANGGCPPARAIADLRDRYRIAVKLWHETCRVVSVGSPVRSKHYGLDIEVRSRDDEHFSRRGRRRIEVFIGREEVSEAVLKWFEDEGRAKRVGNRKSPARRGRTSGSLLILIREVQR